MTKVKLVPASEVLQEALQDPEFKKTWEASAPQRAISDALIDQRIKQKLTQEQLAQKAGMKRPSLARIETGNSTPTITTLQKLAHALGKKLIVKFA